jgi:hypothetical protein
MTVKMSMLVFWVVKPSLKNWYLPTCPNGVTTQKTNINIAVIISEIQFPALNQEIVLF